jgi:hypothetical protein
MGSGHILKMIKKLPLTAIKSNGLGKSILPNFASPVRTRCSNLRKFKSLHYICFSLVLARRHFF